MIVKAKIVIGTVTEIAAMIERGSVLVAMILGVVTADHDLDPENAQGIMIATGLFSFGYSADLFNLCYVM